MKISAQEHTSQHHSCGLKNENLLQGALLQAKYYLMTIVH